jgi:hypothetical protein
MLTERDENILRHVGLYTISIRKVIEHVFFGGADSDNVISRLLESGYLQKNGGDPSRTAALPGGISYYQLSSREAVRLDVPIHRTQPRQPEVLRKSVAVLWYCTMHPGIMRRRLERWELTDLFGKDADRGRGFRTSHAIQLDGNQSAILRLYAPSSAEHTFIRTLRIEADLAAAHATIASWVQRTTYRFVILVESQTRATRLSRRLATLALPVKCSVELAPSLDTLQVECRRIPPGGTQ